VRGGGGVVGEIQQVCSLTVKAVLPMDLACQHQVLWTLGTESQQLVQLITSSRNEAPYLAEPSGLTYPR